METERKQWAIIDHFVNQAAALASAASLANLVLEATSHPSLFAYSEILSVANFSKLEGTPYSSSLDVLRLFTCGTWSDYKRNAGNLPVLLPDQVRKLKQLSVLTLVETEKVLPYDQLMEELDASNARELEDFLINECIYTGIMRGKFNQSRRCFEVHFAAGRDLRPKQLDDLIQTLNNWLSTSDDLLHTIQEKIRWADLTSEENMKHKKEIKDKVEEVKKSVKKMTYLVAGATHFKQGELDLGGQEEGFSEFDRIMDYEEERPVRPKRRRNPMHEGKTSFGGQFV